MKDSKFLIGTNKKLLLHIKKKKYILIFVIHKDPYFNHLKKIKGNMI